jgi:hypothetical protein
MEKRGLPRVRKNDRFVQEPKGYRDPGSHSPRRAQNYGCPNSLFKLSKVAAPYALPSRRGGSDLLASLVIVSRNAGEPAVSPADGIRLLNLFVMT